jgi:peptide/nickel transport system permease protein
MSSVPAVSAPAKMSGFRHHSLLAYALRRVLLLIPLVFVLSVVVFLLAQLVPGGPVAALIGGHATNTATVDALKARYHLNESLFSQYIAWADQVLHGNLGQSIFTSQPVASEIWSRLPISLTLNVVGLFIALVIGIPLGSAAAAHRGRALDRVGVGTGIFFSSAPNFVMAIALVYLLAIHFTIFPLEGLGNGVGGEAYHLVLPCFVMALASLGFITKITRASMLEQRSTDYVAFARARGVPHRRVYTSYIFRNAMIPILTASGLIIATSLTATVFVEDVFGIPGLGGLLVTSAENTDIPVIQGLVLFVAVWVVLANLVIDLCYVAVDPRVSFGAKRS